MKKTIIIISVLAVVLVALICVITFVPKSNSVKNIDILALSAEDDFKEYISNSNIESYSFDKDLAYVNDIELFNKEADIEFYMTDEGFSEINVCFVLFPEEADDEYETDDEVSDDIPEYQFTEKDKNNINKSFEAIKEGFEEYIGCKFTEYDMVPIESLQGVKNNEENFFNGKFLKEYSVRDSDGILWIMRYEASYGSATTVIHKVVNESGYEGFVPGIDLTKK